MGTSEINCSKCGQDMTYDLLRSGIQRCIYCATQLDIEPLKEEPSERCPMCNGENDIRGEARVCLCKHCGYSFPVKPGTFPRLNWSKRVLVTNTLSGSIGRTEFPSAVSPSKYADRS